jgi:hypothetical protein
MSAKRLIVIVEGYSEIEFVNQILKPYFYTKQIFDISVFQIKSSKGGLSKYNHLKTDILNCIYQPNTIITTLIDFYGLPIDFPQFPESQKISNNEQKVDFLEQAVKQELETSQNQKFENFIPYIQLHEFEALIFSDEESIYSNIEECKINKPEIKKIFNEFKNPEEINNDPNTAPSKRLLKNIKGYDKVQDGVLILQGVGLDKILEKCPRFASWLNKITKNAKRELC